MSTRATIGLTLPNEMIVCVYCYRDGYPEHLGRILAKHYDTEEKIRELMKRGHLTDIETTPTLCNFEHKSGAPVAADCRPVTRRNLGDFIQNVRDFGHDYGYIFRDGQWHTYNPNENNRTRCSVKQHGFGKPRIGWPFRKERLRMKIREWHNLCAISDSKTYSKRYSYGKI